MVTERVFYIDNLGCAKNQVDAEVIIAALKSAGWEQAAEPMNAVLIIINTCGFINSAKEESIDVLISYRDAFPDTAVVAAGCLAQRYPEELADSMPELNGIFGNNAVSMIADFAERVTASHKQLVSVPALNEIPRSCIELDDSLAVNRKDLLSGASSAYVKLAEGCNNNCSFCAIPVIRGGLRSRKPESIVMEVSNLVESGIGEINLIAQDLGSYGTDIDPEGRCLLPNLLTELEKLSGDFIVRMLYIHPDNFPFEILDICSGSTRIVPYFDIPFQHASASILKAMNRRGNAEIYLELLKRIREKLPDAVIRTTFMLGFPGENKKDIAALASFIIDARPDWAGFFTYSREEDTAAYEIEGPRRLKRRARAAEKSLAEFQTLQTGITTEALSRFVGRTVRLIVEEGVSEENLYLCRAWFQAPEVDSLVVLHADAGSLKPGDFVTVKLTGKNGIDLEGCLV